MKKFTLIMALFLGLSTVVNAQTYVTDLENTWFGVIPARFTTSGHPYVYYENYLDDEYQISIYNTDFTTHVIDIVGFGELEFLDYNELQEYYLYCSQNLFNDDDAFEYVTKEVEIIYDTIYPYPEEDPEYYYVETDYRYPSFSIVSTNGSTVWTFNALPEYNCDCYALQLENKYYLMVVEWKENPDQTYDYKRHLYLIKQGQGLTEVNADFPIMAYPTMPSRGEQVTVELGEGSNATEIAVVNSLGQVLKRIPVEEGQRTVTIPSRDMGRGLNVLNARGHKSHGACKIIVK